MDYFRGQMRLGAAILLCLLTFFVRAQKENSIWIFPQNMGLNFTTGGKPTVFQPNTGLGHAPASVSDAHGNLLFYSDGDSVWNRTGKVMPNGRDLQSSHGDGMQSTLVLPVVNQPNKYYLFTTQGFRSQLLYSVIDMSLDHGLGDIVMAQKKIVLAYGVGAYIMTVHGNGCYSWLIAHRKGLEFLAFRVDANGIDTIPVISPSYTSASPSSYYQTNVACSPDRKRIALGAQSGYGFVELHDFDAATGIISNPKRLESYGGYGRTHSLCFSPNGNLLYVCGGWSGEDLTQYDLTKLPTIAGQNVNDGYLGGELRLGPDGKIYTVQWEDLSTVLYPDSVGKSCQFSRNYITMPTGIIPQSFRLGVNMPVPVFQTAQHSMDTVVCNDDPVVLRANNLAAYQIWNDGDTASTKTLHETSKYWVQSFRNCNIYTDTFNVTVSNCNCVISIPNAFSPNNDGRNDQFKPLGTDIVELTMRVYNRYGQCVFQTADASHSWNGTYQNQACDVGNYYYFLRARCIKGQEVFKKGEVLLIR